MADIDTPPPSDDAASEVAQAPNTAGKQISRSRRRPQSRFTVQYLFLGLWVIILVLFTVEVLVVQITKSATTDAQGGSATALPAQPSVAQVSSVALEALSHQVHPAEGYALPIKMGNIGPKLLAKGSIDYNRLAQLYQQSGRPLTDEQVAILTKGSDSPVVITSDNAQFLLNFFWALGLTNQNRILTEGPMMQRGKDQVGNFASTGGWTLGTKVASDLYASASLIALTPEQQAHVEEVAKAVYRPCCDNPTHFPDCNHGMAMLGALELMAAQDVDVNGLFTAAKYINAFWFPQHTMEQATYFKASQGLDYATVDARQLAGKAFSSGSGFQTVHQWLADKGLLQQTGGGASCGIQ